MPGIDPGTYAADYADTLASIAAAVAAAPRTASEPPLACYVTATCPAGRAAAQPRSTRSARIRSSALSRPTRWRRRRARAHLRATPLAYAAARVRG